jgi:hypothetical protein
MFIFGGKTSIVSNSNIMYCFDFDLKIWQKFVPDEQL